MRVLFLGTPDFAVPVLEVLCQPPFELAGVVTQPDRPAGRDLKLKPSAIKVAALAKGLKIWTPEKISESEINEWDKLKVQVAVVVAFGQILSQDFLNTFPFGAVNVHASLLPRWRGAGPIQWSLLADDKETGVSLQKMVKKLDAGDVLGEQRIAVEDKMDAPFLYEKLSQMGAHLVREVLPGYLSGRLSPQLQEESLVTWAPKIKKEQGLIDWSRSAREIFCQIRALQPWPGTFTKFEGKTLKVLEVEAVSRDQTLNDNSQLSGSVVEVGKDFIRVACGMGTLKILKVQPESRAAMSVKDFLAGHKIKEGDTL